VDEALGAAAQALGLPQRELRYVVLDAGSAGGRGLGPTPARVAVLLQEAARPAAEASEDRADGAGQPAAGGDVRAGIRATVRSMAEAAHLELDCELREEEEAILVELHGAGCGALYGEDADGEPLRALEHLLLRMYGEALRPQYLRVRCEGFRERREQGLAERARRIAAHVREQGVPQALEPMNAYERRLVHIALEGVPGVRTESRGEGSARRVQIVPVVDGPAENSASGTEDGAQ
jgi:spoIIIJ-associated protein